MRSNSIMLWLFFVIHDCFCVEQLQTSRHTKDISNIGLKVVYGVCSNGVGCSDCQFCPDNSRCSACLQLAGDLPVTSSPSITPTIYPSSTPSRRPTRRPTSNPSAKPSSPTFYPTLYAYYYVPSRLPTTITPTTTSIPTYNPTTDIPTMVPTQSSISPTQKPTSRPFTPYPTIYAYYQSPVPSSKPSIIPTRIPSIVPSTTPTVLPSATPSIVLSNIPSAKPSLMQQSTFIPSVEPTYYYGYPPTSKPTKVPSITVSPSIVQSLNPSSQPTISPSRRHRTLNPNLIPTSNPTYYDGSNYPSISPIVPTNVPSIKPTFLPSVKLISGTITPTTSISYIYLGCYGDKPGARALSVNLGTVSSVTACYRRAVADALESYKYFGLQYGDECWVSNNYTSSTQYGVCGSLGSSDATTNCVCNMKCINLIDDCGGGKANSLYQVSTVGPPSSTPINKPTNKPVISTNVPTKSPVVPTLSPSFQLVVPVPSVQPVVGSPTDSPSKSPSITPTSAIPSKLQIATSSPTAIKLYTYIGCYGDSTVRALQFSLGNVNSIAACYSLASAAGYKYFGLQYGGECWASSDYASATQYGVCGSLGSTGATFNCVCTMKCSNGIDNCGGANANALYQVSVVTSSLPSFFPTTKPTIQPVITTVSVPTKTPVIPSVTPSFQPVTSVPTSQPIVTASVPTKVPVTPTSTPITANVLTLQPVAVSSIVPSTTPAAPTSLPSVSTTVTVIPSKIPIAPSSLPSVGTVVTVVPSTSPIPPTNVPSIQPSTITSTPSKRPVTSSPTAQTSPTIQLPYEYLGCYGDSTERAMQESVGYATSIENCYNLTVTANFLYFGLQYGGECWASNDYDSATKYGVCGSAESTGLIPDCVCTMKCTNEIDDCGGPNANALYKVIDLTPTHTPTSIPTSEPTYKPTFQPSTYSPTYFPTYAPTGVAEASFTVTQLISNVSVTSSVTQDGLSEDDALVLITTIFNVTEGITFKQIVTILNTTYIEVIIPSVAPTAEPTVFPTSNTSTTVITMVLRQRKLASSIPPNLLVTYNIFYKFQPDINNGTVLFNEYKSHILTSISDGSFTNFLQNNAATIMPYITSTATTATTTNTTTVIDMRRKLLLSTSVFGYAYCNTPATFGSFITGDAIPPPTTTNNESSPKSTKTALIVSVVMVFVILILCCLVGLFCYRDTSKNAHSKKELPRQYGTGLYDPDDDKLSDDESEYYPPPAYSSLNQQSQQIERRDSFLSEASRKTFDRPITIADSSEEVHVNNNPLVDRMRKNSMNSHSVPPPPQSPPSSSSSSSSAIPRYRTDSHLQSEYNSNFSATRNKMANQEVDWSEKDNARSSQNNYYRGSNNSETDGQSQQSDKKSLKDKMTKLKQERESRQIY